MLVLRVACDAANEAAPGTPGAEGGAEGAAAEGATTDATSLLAGALLGVDPAEEAAKAAATAEVQAQQEATMAALDAVASSKPAATSPVSQVLSLIINEIGHLVAIFCVNRSKRLSASWLATSTTSNTLLWFFAFAINFLLLFYKVQELDYFMANLLLNVFLNRLPVIVKKERKVSMVKREQVVTTRKVADWRMWPRRL